MVITNGYGITINLQVHMNPCTITSFDDHFDIAQLTGDQPAVDMEM
jgi:hypothetical protein